MRIAKVSIARRRAVPTMTEQLADQRQVLARHDSLAGGGVPKVMQAEPAEVGVFADRAPTGDEAVFPAPFGVIRKQKAVRFPPAGQRVDERPRGLAERHRSWTSLGLNQIQRVLADVPPTEIEYFAPAATGEREQPDGGDGLAPLGFAGVERAPEPGQFFGVEKGICSVAGCGKSTLTRTAQCGGSEVIDPDAIAARPSPGAGRRRRKRSFRQSGRPAPLRWPPSLAEKPVMH